MGSSKPFLVSSGAVLAGLIIARPALFRIGMEILAAPELKVPR